MKSTRMLAALTAAILFTACSREPEPAANANPLLAWVPADTPYVMANLQAVPADVVDAHLERMQPLLDQAQQQLNEVQGELESGNIEVNGDDDLAVMKAVLAELDGKMNRAGLESMGLTLEAFQAVYGIGMFPVARVSLGDPEKFRAMLGRIEAAGATVPEYDYQGQPYWRVDDADSGLSGLAAIHEDHVVLSLLPTNEEAAWLPKLLGNERPADSMVDGGALARMVTDKGFEPYGAGYVDVGAALEEMLQADRPMARHLARTSGVDVATMDPSCAREARLIAAFVPRLLAGTTELTGDAIGLRYQMELQKTLAGDLMELVSDVPAAATGPENIASMAMSVEVGRLRRYLQDQTAAMAALPFQCPQLAELNDDIRQMATQLEQPMPPFIGNLKGFRAVLDAVDPANPDFDNVRGMLSLEMVSPQMVVGMASMLVPGIEELNMEPGGDPVQLPQELMTVATPEFEMYALMTDDAIGLSVGKGQKDFLPAFMDQRSDGRGVFLSAEYDSGYLAELQRTHMGADDHLAPEDAAAMVELQESLRGRTRVEVLFDAEGLTIDQRQTYR